MHYPAYEKMHILGSTMELVWATDWDVLTATQSRQAIAPGMLLW
jgi:hypothetical protein